MDGARFMDSETFEACLRRLNALENKLTNQVSIDIQELKRQWIQKRVDRVTTNAFKLYQVREQLKQSRRLYVEEERILTEFNRVKEMLVENSMDDEAFDATKETCIVLGQKLTGIRNRQKRLDGEIQDMETTINTEIMAIKYEDKDFAMLDLQEVRAKTPVRELSPTPLDRHRARSRSKDPSPFRMPPLRISSGSVTPGDSKVADPHAYFSRPESRESLYGGRGVGKNPELEAFRAQMEAKQAEDESPPAKRGGLSKSMSGNIVLRDASGQLIAKSDANNVFNLAPGGGEMFSQDQERPGSAMSECSINIGDGMEFSRPGSGMSVRMESDIGDAMFLTKDAELEAFRANFEAKQAEVWSNGQLEELQSEEEEAAKQQKKEEDEKLKKMMDEQAARMKEEADERRRQFEEKRQLEEEEKRKEDIKRKAEEEEKRKEEEAKKKASEAARKEAEKAERLERIQKKKEEAEKKRLAEEKAKEEMAKRAADLQARKDKQAQEMKEEKLKKLEEKKAKIKEAEDKKKADEEKAKAFEEKKAAAAEKKKLAVKKKKKKEEATEAEKIQLAVKEALKDEQVVEHTKLDEFEQKLAELESAELVEGDIKSKNIMEKTALAKQKEEELQIKIDDVKDKIRKRSLSRGRSRHGSRDASRDRASARRSGEFSASEDETTNKDVLDTKKKSLQKDVEDLESSLISASSNDKKATKKINSRSTSQSKTEADQFKTEQPKPKPKSRSASKTKITSNETEEEKQKAKGQPVSRSNSKKLGEVEKCESSAEEAEISAYKNTDDSESYAPKTTEEETTGDSSDPFSEALAEQDIPKIKSRSNSRSKKATEETEMGSDKDIPIVKSRSKKASNKIERDESSTEETETSKIVSKSRPASKIRPQSNEVKVTQAELEVVKPKSRTASRCKASDEVELDLEEVQEVPSLEVEQVKPKSRSASRNKASKDEALVQDKEQEVSSLELEIVKPKSRSASRIEVSEALILESYQDDQKVSSVELEPAKPKRRSTSRTEASEALVLEPDQNQEISSFELEPVKPKSRSASRTEASEALILESYQDDQKVSSFDLEPAKSKIRSASRTEASETLIFEPYQDDQKVSSFELESAKLKSRSASRTEASEALILEQDKDDQKVSTFELEPEKTKSRSSSRTEASEALILEPYQDDQKVSSFELDPAKPKSRSASRTEALEALVLESDQNQEIFSFELEPAKPKSRSTSRTGALVLEPDQDQKVSPYELEPVKQKSIFASRNKALEDVVIELEMDQEVFPFELEPVKPKSRSTSRSKASEDAVVEPEMDQEVSPFELEPVKPKSRSTSRSKASEDVLVEQEMENEAYTLLIEEKPEIKQRSTSRGRPTEKAFISDTSTSKGTEEKVIHQNRSAKKRQTSRGMSEIKPADVIAAREAIDGIPLGKREGSLGAQSHENVDTLKPSSKQGSRGGSRAESPVSILKKPGQSRSASRDRAGKMEDGGRDEKHPLSRSSSFRAKFGEKKKISFDDDVDPSTIIPQPGATADVLSAIADTSLQSGLKQRSRDASRERPAITLTFETDPISGFSGPTEPADYYPPEEGDEEDELMIVFDSPHAMSGQSGPDRISPGENKSRSASRESGSRSRGLTSKSADSSEKANESSSSLRKQHLQQRKPDNNEYSEADPPPLEGVDEHIGRIRSSSQTSRSSFGLPGKKSRSASGVPELEIIAAYGDRPLSDVLDYEFQSKDGVSQQLDEGLQAATLGVKRSTSRGLVDGDFGLDRQDNLGYDKNSLANVGSDVPMGNIAFKSFSNKEEDIYATVIPRSQRKMYEEPQDSSSSAYTEEGFVINKENELDNIDHTSLKYQDYIYGEEPLHLDDEVTEYDIDELTGRRTKKVSFAEEDERHEFERQAKAKGIGKLFSFVPHKPMISLPGIEKRVDVVKPAEATFPESIRASSREDVPAPERQSPEIPPTEQKSAKTFISAMTGGLIKARSPTPNREGLFGSLLRRKGSKTSSRNSSLDRNEEMQGRSRGVLKQPHGSQSGSITSSRRSSADGSGSYLSDFEQLNADKTSLQADIQDLSAELSFTKRLGKKMRRKPAKVTKVDFDQLFAGGMAKSAEYESQSTNLDPFKNQNLPPQVANGSHKVPTYDENGTRFTPFEVYSQEDAFKKSQEGEGIGYAEKVESYLYEQANLTSKSKLPVGEIQQPDRGRQRHRDGKETGSGPTSLRRKEKGPRGPPLVPQTKEAEFLKKATQFVANNEVDSQYSQPVWPATPSQDMMPSLREPGPDALRTLEQYSPQIPLGASPTRLAPSPGKSFLESKSGAELFRTSIEQIEMPSTIPTILEPLSGERTLDASGMPTTLFVAPIPPSRSPRRSCSPNIQVTVSSPPRPNEPGDKGLPNQLKPDILMANEEFYEKLRTGLHNFGSTQSGLNQETVKAMAGMGNAEFYKKLTSGLKTFSQASADPMFGQLKDKVAPGMGHEEFYNKLSSGLNSINTLTSDPVFNQKDQPDFSKYSHHLGRAEFGTLRKASSKMGSTAVSRDASGDRVKGSRDPSGDRIRLSRNTSADKINVAVKQSRKSSNASATSGMEIYLQRSDSRMSDYSGMIPDLEMDDVGDFVSEEELRMVHKTQSLIVDQKISQPPPVIDPNADVLQKKQEVLLEIDRHRQEVREKKAWIQNGLMSALGFCVVVYLQTLEAAGVGQ